MPLAHTTRFLSDWLRLVRLWPTPVTIFFTERLRCCGRGPSTLPPPFPLPGHRQFSGLRVLMVVPGTMSALQETRALQRDTPSLLVQEERGKFAKWLDASKPCNCMQVAGPTTAISPASLSALRDPSLGIRLG